MSKQLVTYALEDGSEITVEVDVAPGTGMVPASRGGAPAKAAKSFSKALDTLRPAAQAVVDKLRSLSDPPDEVKVEFGLKLGAEAGAILASSSIEANYKITLTWKHEQAEKPQ